MGLSRLEDDPVAGVSNELCWVALCGALIAAPRAFEELASGNAELPAGSRSEYGGGSWSGGEAFDSGDSEVSISEESWPKSSNGGLDFFPDISIDDHGNIPEYWSGLSLSLMNTSGK